MHRVNAENLGRRSLVCGDISRKEYELRRGVETEAYMSQKPKSPDGNLDCLIVNLMDSDGLKFLARSLTCAILAWSRAS